MTGCPRFLRVLPAVLLIAGAAVSLAPVSPVLAATVSDCPTTESALQTDISNAGPGGTVQLACSGPTIIPFSSTTTINQSVTLDAGTSAGSVTFDGSNSGNPVQLFVVNSPASFTLNALTLQNASTSCAATVINGGCLVGGGAVGNFGGTVTITNSTFSGNSVTCTGDGCQATGGAIFLNAGTLTIANSTFSGNSSSCTLALGVACISNGGAIYIAGGSVMITNSTFSGNSATCTGSGCEAEGGAIFLNAGTLTIGGTILANSTGGNCSIDGGTISDWGYNLEDTADTDTGTNTCHFSTANHDLIDTNPDLSPLGNNGGPTETMALSPTSPAIDYIPTSYDIPSTSTPLCPSTDQRGEPRPDGASENACDIGAYEFQGDTSTSLSSSPNPSTTGQQVTVTATVSPSDSSPTPAGTVTFEDTTTHTTLCTAVPLSNGQAPCQTSSLSAGVHTITATYTPTTGTDFMSSTGTLVQGVSTTVPNGTSAYDIESSNWSCNAGGITCIPLTDTDASQCVSMTPCPGATYGDVEAFGPASNATNGIPDELILACVQGTDTGYQIGYLDVLSHQGSLDYPGGVYGTADPGTISGKGTLIGGGGGEDNPSQPSSVTASVYDVSTGIIGSVSGIQNTDNGSNTLNSGQFRVTIRGRLWTVNLMGTSPVFTQNATSSTMSCTVGGSHANDLRNAGLDTVSLAEGELEPSLGDNFFLQSVAPHS